MAKLNQKTRGRRPALNQEMIDKLVEEVRRVHYAKFAIHALGYSERVLYKWLERGEKELTRMEEKNLVNPAPDEKSYVDLVVSMRRAKAENIRLHATNLQRGGLGQPAQYLKNPDGTVILDPQTQRPILLQAEIPSNWMASARYLEAVAHEEFGRKIRTELTTPDHGPSELRITVVKKRQVIRDVGDDEPTRGGQDE